jgi:Na+/H+-dicarboxylate symporter
MGSEVVAMCVSALVAVFVLLGVLAAVMKVILLIFPEQVKRRADPALLAAVASSVEAAHPGMRVTKIEELE